jgi:hypothetical protein
MPSNLPLATRGYWRPASSSAINLLVGSASIHVVIADQGVNPNEVYVGEQSQPLSIAVEGAVDAGFNNTDWIFRVSMANRETGELKINGGTATLSFDGRIPILSHPFAAEEIDTLGKYWFQFRATLVADPTRRLLFEKRPLVVRAH